MLPLGAIATFGALPFARPDTTAPLPFGFCGATFASAAVRFDGCARCMARIAIGAECRGALRMVFHEHSSGRVGRSPVEAPEPDGGKLCIICKTVNEPLHRNAVRDHAQ